MATPFLVGLALPGPELSSWMAHQFFPLSPEDKGEGEAAGDGYQGTGGNGLQVMGMFLIVIVVMVAQVKTYVRIHQIIHFT